jgi:hypothetical protein
MTVVLSLLALVGVVVVLLWLIGLPGDEDEEEAAGFITANWDRIRDRFDR